MQILPAICGRFTALFSAMLLCAATAAAEPAVLKVCADTWMPFNGDPQTSKPGYVVEMLREIYEPQGVKVEYSLMPYAEALEAVHEGRIDAVIGPDEKEGNGLVLPREPMGKPCILLLTKVGSGFNYDNIRSLRKAKLGVIKGYSYWDILDDHIAKGEGVVACDGDEPLADLFSKLEKDEITILVDMESVLLWYLRQHKLERSAFRAVYRHEATATYVAFAPNDKGRALSAQFDAGVAGLRSSGKLGKILAGYGLKDWVE